MAAAPAVWPEMTARIGRLSMETAPPLGIIWPHEPVNKTEIGTGKFMLRTTMASSRSLRVCVFGLVTITSAVIFTSDSAHARRYRHGQSAHHVRPHEARESYNPAF